MFDLKTAGRGALKSPIAISELDAALTAQIVVAWAGEHGEGKRLGWWRSDLVSQFGGRQVEYGALDAEVLLKLHAHFQDRLAGRDSVRQP